MLLGWAPEQRIGSARARLGATPLRDRAIPLPDRGMSTLDPIKLEIIRGAIRAAQAEMDALLERTAISAFIREKKDFYTALFDADGVMVVGSMVPIFGDITGPVFARFPPDTMRRAISTGTATAMPRAARCRIPTTRCSSPRCSTTGNRAAFVMGWAHFSDIGGLRPGSISSDATEIFHEGIIIPPTKLIDAGTTNEAALEIFYRNSRYPETCRGDARALMASVDLGVRRIGEILDRFGPDVVADAFRALVRAHPHPGARPPARDLRRGHPSLRRRDRLRRPRQRPVLHPPRADPHARTTASSWTPPRPTTRRPVRSTS